MDRPTKKVAYRGGWVTPPKNIHKLEEKVATFGNQQDYASDILLSWMLSPYSDRYKDMTTIILLGSLIHPTTAEVEQSF